MPDFSEMAAREVTRQLRKKLDHLDVSSLADRVDLSSLAERIPKQVMLESPVVREAEERAANRGFIGGFLAGAVVGAILALIFAPRRGAETRDLIAHTASDVGEKVSNVVGHNESVGGAIDTLKAKASEAATKVSDAVGQEKEHLEETLDDAASTATEQGKDDGEENGSTPA